MSTRGRYSDEFLLDEIREFYDKFGRPPKYRDLKRSVTISKRFGSFKRALELCGINYFAERSLDGWPRNDRILNGYKVVYRPDHFCCLGGSYDGYVYEHKYKMELKIGRALRKNEVVHHKDGDRLNNDIGNLMLMTRSNHVRFHNLKCDESFLVENEDGSFSCKPPVA